jgi:XRE family aerobic/anaerobic benzoate catabolism transcriptional regulator
MARVVAQGDMRPMEGNAEAMEDMRRILATREPLYSKADFVLDTTARQPEDCVQQLLQIITS